MTKPEGQDAHLREIAREVLSIFSEISGSAPPVARAVAIDEHDKKYTYYICRGTTTPVLKNKEIKLANQRAPIGRLASLPVGDGDEIKLPSGEILYLDVAETARLRPVMMAGEWDSENTVLAGEIYGPLTVSSLRALLKHAPGGGETEELDRLLKEADAAEIIQNGIRRNVIVKMELRDQPILDQYQDEIFRLPLNSRLLILGAPGTGKTTTLIRRLGQKLDRQFLDTAEQNIVKAEERQGRHDYAQSWLMFAPTTLLRLYVKEAFNREDVPASDERIKTWNEFRNYLARSEFGILQTSSGGGSFVMKEEAEILETVSQEKPVDWFKAFDEWQKLAFAEKLRSDARTLTENESADVKKAGAKIRHILGDADTALRPGAFVSLAGTAAEVRDVVKNLKMLSDQKIRVALNRQVKWDGRFLESLADFVNDLSDLNDDLEGQDEDAEEEDEEQTRPQTGRHGAAVHYMRALRAQARARARGRNVSNASRAGQIIEWLDGRMPSDAELKEVGKSLLTQTALNRFVNPVRSYINGIPARYRRFRREEQTKNLWYRAEGFKPADIHPLEVDVILLAMIRSTDELIRSSRTFISEGSPAKETLERLQYLQRAQILVDEATDFSPVQLACMAHLRNPAFDSFIACGDFNQRVTNWGTKTEDEFKWAVPGIEIQRISTAYRQSRELHEFAQKITGLSGEPDEGAELPEYAEDEGVRPALIENLSGDAETADWLARRIIEIEQFIGELPSIAVLVHEETRVKPMAAELKGALAEQNIRVTACSDGQVLGQEDGVRVFDVQHIKGLEFEAVFFIGLDELAQSQENLFDKYLYVGATRAATYLGVTCERELPDKMAALRELFCGSWA